MEFKEVVARRRTVRQFKDKAVEREKIERIIEAGVMALSFDHAKMKAGFILSLFALMSFSALAVTVEVAEGESEAVKIAAENLRRDLDKACPAHTNDTRRIVVRTGGPLSSAAAGWESSVRTYKDGVWTVTGVDRRGTVYGIYKVSEELGVSPFYWWDDIPVTSHEFNLTTETVEIKSPAVKYRGIFINDEDIGIRKWAEMNYEADGSKSLGAKTYEKIFEMMLRARLNYIWPAMHPGGYEFVSRRENMELAAKMGIVVGTSHCEPMLRNNIYLSKPDKAKWDYLKNPDFINGYWQWSVDNYGDQDCVWTIGMRGIHDGGMPGKDKAEKIATMERIFAKQCEMLGDRPKLFVPYKEVLKFYNMGLKVPKDATIMWPNDNYGYIRRLGGPQAAGYPGGIYWHVSYCGRPHNYMHVCTTPPGFLWWELGAKCAANDTREIWMVNVGDVKPADLLIFALGKIAWKPETYGPDAQEKILDEWVTQFVGRCASSHSATSHSCDGSINCLGCLLVAHLSEYYNLGFIRKPEHMSKFWVDSLTDETKAELAERYEQLLDEEDAIEELLGDRADNWFSAIGFQVRFIAETGLAFLVTKREDMKARVKTRLGALRRRYDTIFGGKWRGFYADVENERMKNGNLWWSQMQWPWNDVPARTREGGMKNTYNTTQGDLAAVKWIDAADFVLSSPGANGGAWTSVAGLGRSGHAIGLYPVKPGIGESAVATYKIDNPVNPVNPVEKESRTLVIECLPDFALWPGMKLRFEVKVNGGETIICEVPRSDANINEGDSLRHAAVQDGFIRIEVPVTFVQGENTLTIAAIDPGVAIDRIGVK